MTKQEFIVERDALEKTDTRFSIIWFALFFGYLFSNMAFLYLKIELVPKQYAQFLFYGVLIGFSLVLWMRRRHVQKFHLPCPNCKKSLTHAAGQIVVATGNCGYCGVKLFS